MHASQRFRQSARLDRDPGDWADFAEFGDWVDFARNSVSDGANGDSNGSDNAPVDTPNGTPNGGTNGGAEVPDLPISGLPEEATRRFPDANMPTGEAAQKAGVGFGVLALLGLL